MTLVKKLMMKIPNLKLVILLECQNIRTFLQKAVKKFWKSKQLETLCRDPKGKKIFGTIYEKELQKASQKTFFLFIILDKPRSKIQNM